MRIVGLCLVVQQVSLTARDKYRPSAVVRVAAYCADSEIQELCCHCCTATRVLCQ